MLLIVSMLYIAKYISNSVLCNSDILQLNASMILRAYNYFHHISSFSLAEILYALKGLLMGLDIFALSTVNFYLDIVIIRQCRDVWQCTIRIEQARIRKSRTSPSH